MSTRDKLLSVCRDFLDKEGLDHVSMRNIGNVAGLSRTAVYRHFNSKDDLLAVITEENFRRLENEFNNLIIQFNDEKEILENILLLYYKFGTQNPHHYKLMFNVNWSEESYPEISRLAGKLFSDISMLLNGSAGFKISNELNSSDTTAILFSFIHGLVNLHIHGHSQKKKGLDDPVRLIKQMVGSVI